MFCSQILFFSVNLVPRALFPQSQGKAPWGRGCFSATVAFRTNVLPLADFKSDSSRTNLKLPSSATWPLVNEKTDDEYLLKRISGFPLRRACWPLLSLFSKLQNTLACTHALVQWYGLYRDVASLLTGFKAGPTTLYDLYRL